MVTPDGRWPVEQIMVRPGGRTLVRPPPARTLMRRS